MPSTHSFLAFAALSAALIAVPGPSVMFVVGRGVALGRRAALLTVVGNTAGIYVQVVLVALGLGAIVERSTLAFSILKLIGAGYLVWLGVSAIRDRGDTTVDGDPERVRTPGALVRDGFIVGVANPKAIAFFAAILPQFVSAGGRPAGVQMMALGLVFALVALILDSTWGLAAGTARNWFATSPRRLARLRAAGGLTMIGLGARLAISGRAE